MPETSENRRNPSLLGRIVDLFLRSDLAPLLIVVSLLAGLAAIVLTPREEEPQIVVPMADVIVSAPGLAVAEVERQIATPLEKLLFQIDGVEHVYSASHAGHSVVTVRFYVGEDREDSLIKIYNKLLSNTDTVPPDLASWVVKPVEIDDVPIVTATIWSERPEKVDDHGVRRIAEEIEIALQSVPQTNRAQIVGGRPRVVRVELNPDNLSARRTSALDVAFALGVSNVRKPSGTFDTNDRNFQVDAGDFVTSVEALKDLVVNVVDGIPVRLRDVADVRDGPAERTSYSWIGFGPAEKPAGENVDLTTLYPAVHIAIAKQKGANAVWVADRIEHKLAELATTHLPEGVRYRITRNYGETANDKVNELLEALAVAILIVVGLIAFSLGWRQGLVVAAAVPITFALTLLVNYWAGYTINRVTLFALILSLGLVVDDPIVDVENIHRHLAMRKQNALEAVRTAVNEVRPPILLATAAVIVSFLPMMLITGMMGPYMRPMALNVPVAMVMSMVVAFTVTPWLAYRALRSSAARGEAEPGAEIPPALLRFYRAVLGPFLDSRTRAWALLAVTFLLFVGAGLLAATRAVPLKMLPFDNKNELQITIDAPEGTTLERTDAVASRLAGVLRRAPEVTDLEIFTGLSSPMDFNGMVRQSYLRRGAHVGDIRVNLVPKRARVAQSHEIALRLRPQLQDVARAAGVRIKVVEVPPGPPVLATVTAEVYGEPGVPYNRIRAAAKVLEARLVAEPGVSDVDTTVEDDTSRFLFVADQEKAALSGVATDDISRTIAMALSGLDITRFHVAGEANPLNIRLRLPRSRRSGLTPLRGLAVKGRPGISKIRERGGVRDAPVPVVRLGELGRFEDLPAEKAIYHKNVVPVAFVFAEAVGRAPAEIVADVAADLADAAPDQPGNARPLGPRTYFSNGGGIPWTLPDGIRISWLDEGELNITVDVFRDLGIAFAVALVGIYFVLVYQTASYAMPLILMISIPLTLIGIMPGFWLLNTLTGGNVGGYANPTFFTATAMIGVIALSGIAVRNAILLIEFLHIAMARGAPLRDALLQAGAVRTRAIVLTAGTAMLAAVPITLDPVFSGLAWALIFGLVVSTAFTLVIVPVAYDLVYRGKPGHGLPARLNKEAAS
ncbi:MAG: efflux RND transporter permease subunit [Aestuariivirgaceae bacterium]